MIKYYTGVGTRDTPPDIFELAVWLGSELAKKGYTLRSGAAAGMDTAFQHGCSLVDGYGDIYIPWKGFHKKNVCLGKSSNVKYYTPTAPKFNIAREYLICEDIIPWFDNMKQGAQKLHARNYYQVVGHNNIKSDICLWYANIDKNGEPKGGTRTTVLLARSFGIEDINIGKYNTKDKLLKLLERL